MNRPVKFRAWDGKKMHEQAQLVFCTSNGSLATAGGKTLTQFTGLTDKNGKEIYEGDYMRLSETGTVGKVVWSDVFDAWKLAYPHGESEALGDFRWDYSHGDTRPRVMEVIGNIYENPNLLSV